MMHLSEEKKSLKNMGLNGWCLFCLNLSCISPLLCLLKTDKKKILCMTCLAVIMMSICEMCIKSKNEEKKKRKKKSVDALIVHVVRLVGLTSSCRLPQAPRRDVDKTCGTRHNEKQ